MNILTRYGDQVNVSTYEHFCDTIEDMKNIDPKKINLGSICVVLSGSNGKLQFYIANSKKEWILASNFSSSSEEEQQNEEETIPVILIDNLETLAAELSSTEPSSIKLNNSLNLTSTLSIPADKELTIDLNNQSIETSTVLFQVNGGTLILNGDGNITARSNIANIFNGGKVVVNGGTYISNADNCGFGAVGAGSIIEFNNGSLTTVEGGIMAFDGGTIIFNGGTLNTTDNFAIATNGSADRGGNTITMNGGTINANITSNGYEAIGIYLPNDDTFVMNGGTVIANNGAGIVQRGGSCTINDGNIIATGAAGTSGWVGDNKTKMSKSAIIYHQTANYPAKDTIQLTINGGTFTGVDHSLEILTDEENPKVTVNGGIFNPPYNP